MRWLDCLLRVHSPCDKSSVLCLVFQIVSDRSPRRLEYPIVELRLRKNYGKGGWRRLRALILAAGNGSRRAMALMRKYGQKGLKSGLKNLSELRQKQNCLNYCMRPELKLRGEFFRNFSVIRVTEPGKIGFYRFLSNQLFLSVIKAKNWWILPGSNQRPKVYETSALTTELRIHE